MKTSNKKHKKLYPGTLLEFKITKTSMPYHWIIISAVRSCEYRAFCVNINDIKNIHVNFNYGDQYGDGFWTVL